MVVNLISGPRNVSTALMYSFAQHPDFVVFDEPLYAHYLNVSGAKHPGYQEILSSNNQDGNKVLHDILSGGGESHIFIKNMAHHHIKLDYSYLLEVKNVFLTRDPRDMLPTLINQIPHPSMQDTAYRRQWNLFNYLRAKGNQPMVLDAKQFLNDPGAALLEIADSFGFEYADSMLSWQEGPKPFDGVWAKYWYQKLHKSTGFKPYIDKVEDFPIDLVPLLHECDIYYHKLMDKKYE